MRHMTIKSFAILVATLAVLTLGCHRHTSWVELDGKAVNFCKKGLYLKAQGLADQAMAGVSFSGTCREAH